MQIFVNPQKVAGDRVIFGDTNISLLNSMGQHFHSLLSNRRALNKETNNLLTLGFSIDVNNVTTFPSVSSHFLNVAQIPHTHAQTHISMLPRESREGHPAAVFSAAYSEPSYSDRVERSGCGKPKSPFPFSGSLTPVGTFVLMIGKHTLPYLVFPGIDFRRGQGIWPTKPKMTLHKHSIHPPQREATPFPPVASTLTHRFTFPPDDKPSKQLRHTKLFWFENHTHLRSYVRKL